MLLGRKGTEGAMMDFRAELANELPYLRRFGRALAGDPAVADDLVQDCIERALASLGLNLEERGDAVLRSVKWRGLRAGPSPPMSTVNLMALNATQLKSCLCKMRAHARPWKLTGARTNSLSKLMRRFSRRR